MVYSKSSEGTGSGGYVVSILVDGQVLPERSDGQVILPFETEYQIRLRNKTNKDAVSKIYIDEECICPEGLIIRKRKYVDLDRPTTKPKKFKFVAVDSFDAVDAGKNRENDPSMGVIKVEFYPEKQYIPYYPVTPLVCTGPIRPRSYKGLSSLGASDSYSPPADTIESGATVDGSHSNQTFVTEHIDVDWDTSVVIKVVLKGFWRDEVKKYDPVIRQAVRNCPNCGAKRKRPSAKFCELCGDKF